MADPQVFMSPEFEVDPLGTAAASNYTPPEPVSQSAVLAGTPQNIQAHIVEQQQGRREVGKMETVNAALGEMTPEAAWRWATTPAFEPDPEFTAAERISTLDTQLNDGDRKFLMKATSSDALEFRIGNMERSRDNYKKIGDNPVTGIGIMMLDPSYFAVDIASLGAGRLLQGAKVGMAIERAAAGLAGGAGAVGLTALEGQTRPVSTHEFVMNGLLNGAASATFYNRATKRLEPTDPDFPDKVLNDLTRPGSPNTVRNPDALIDQPMHTFSAPDVKAPRNAQELAEDLSRVYKGTDLEDVVNAILKAPELAGIKVSTSEEVKALSPKSRGFVATQHEEAGLLSAMFGPGRQKVIHVAANGPADVALHELAHAVLETRLFSPKFAKQLAEVKKMQTAVQRELSLQGKRPDQGVTPGGKRFWSRQFESTGEFLAYGMTSPSFREWARVAKLTDSGAAHANHGPVGGFVAAPVPLTVWDKFMDVVSSVFGQGKPRVEQFLANKAVREAYLDSGAQYKALDKRMDEIAEELTRDGAPANMFQQEGISARRAMDLSENALGAAIVENADKFSVRVAKNISWSLHKSLSSFSPEAKRIADLLVDDPINMAGDSVVSQTRAIRADLAAPQYLYEDALKNAMAANGAGIIKRIFSPRASMKVQSAIERKVADEMRAMEQVERTGGTYVSQATPEIQNLAKLYDASMKNALKELERAGVTGVEDVAAKSGWFSRKWDVGNYDSIVEKLMVLGGSEASARGKVQRMVKMSLRRANGWADELAEDVSNALIDRMRRKGYFEDSAFRSHAGNEALAEVRDMLRGSGISDARQQRVLDLLAGKVDEAGKAPILKHRVELDYKAGIQMPDGGFVRIGDLLNSDLAKIQEGYLDMVAGTVALTKKGLGSVSEQGALRKELARSIPEESRRKQAIDLFDQTMNAILGRPVGEDLPQLLRAAQAVTRMVGLPSSGLWQVTEYSSAMARFGAIRTLKYMFKELPGARKLFQNAARDGSTATQLHSILTRNSSADIRMRPYVARLEDNFDIPTSANVQMALQQAQQLVPYLNAQKMVQTHQARVVANLVIDSLRDAGRGNVRARAAWEQYGLKVHIMEELQAQIAQHGTDTAKWSDGIWDKVRGPLTKAMDEAVLRSRTGEIPAFAQFSQVGKFIFTFRSFVLAAHNKVLAGSMGREGFAGVGLIALYQMPLAMLMTAANAKIQGKEIKDDRDLVVKSFGQMGSFGLFSDMFGIISGTKQQFGAPGLISIDRMYKTLGQAAQGNGSAALDSAISSMPILAIIPGMRAIGNSLKE